MSASGSPEYLGSHIPSVQMENMPALKSVLFCRWHAVYCARALQHGTNNQSGSIRARFVSEGIDEMCQVTSVEDTSRLPLLL